MDSAAKTPSLDHAFLEAVEADLARALEQVEQFAEPSETTVSAPDYSWQNSLTRLSDNLAAWQTRLGELSRQTTEVEGNLSAQEKAIREWFRALGKTSEQMASRPA